MDNVLKLGRADQWENCLTTTNCALLMLREQGFGTKAIISSYTDKGWKLSTVKKVCSRVDHTGSAVLHKPASGTWRPATAYA